MLHGVEGVGIGHALDADGCAAAQGQMAYMYLSAHSIILNKLSSQLKAGKNQSNKQ